MQDEYFFKAARIEVPNLIHSRLLFQKLNQGAVTLRQPPLCGSSLLLFHNLFAVSYTHLSVKSPASNNIFCMLILLSYVLAD